jgi:VanZ family protein
LSARRWLPPLAWAGVILLGTSLPQDAVPVSTTGIDKILHFTIYSVFAFLLTRQISEDTTRWRAVAGAIVVAAAFGVVDEWHQGFIPGRSPELADWIADATGAAFGAVACALLLLSRSTPAAQR